MFVDAARRGEVLDAAAASARYPDLALALGGPRLPHDTRPQPESSNSGTGPCAVAGAWSDMARTLMLAHQRRGESDEVAHWMYLLMALDPGAPEWNAILHT